jgi:maleate isomerase
MIRLSPQLSLGWRAKIGVLYPEHGYLDEEFWGFAAPGVTVLMARTRVQPDDTVPSIRRFAVDPDNDRTAQGFARVNIDAVAYACTAIGFVRGPGGDEDINRRMSLASRAPATCTITASIAAMQCLGVTRIAVGTPYSEELNELLCGFLEHHGIAVVNLKGLDIVGVVDGAAVNDVSLHTVARLAKSVDTNAAEAVYLPCTSLRTLEILEALEEDMGKPVVSANQSTMWHAQRLAGVNAPLTGLGRLFRAGAEAGPSSNLPRDVTLPSKARSIGGGR